MIYAFLVMLVLGYIGIVWFAYFAWWTMIDLRRERDGWIEWIAELEREVEVPNGIIDARDGQCVAID